MPSDLLLHLLTPDDARALEPARGWAPPSLAREGFLHLCWSSQQVGVQRRHFRGEAVFALVIDPHRLPAGQLVEEDLYGHGAFPHLYGPIPAEAILEVREIPALP